MIKTIVEICRETSDKIWNQQGRHTHDQLDDILLAGFSVLEKQMKVAFEKEKKASHIALLTLLVESGEKGDMERLIKEFTEQLKELK